MLTATIGHNQPPSFEEILHERNAKLLEAASEIILDAEALPKLIEDQKQADTLTDFIKTAADTSKKLEAIRIAEKEPYLTGGKKVDKFFGGHIDCLDSVIKKAKKPLTDYMAVKEEEERKRLLAVAEEQCKAAEAAAKQAQELASSGLEMQAEAAQDVADAKKTEAATAAKAAAGSGLVQSVGHLGTAGITKRWVGEVEDYALIDLNALRGYFSEDSIQKAINVYVAAGKRELAGVKIYQKSSVNVR